MAKADYYETLGVSKSAFKRRNQISIQKISYEISP